MLGTKTISKVHPGYGIAVRDERDITVCKEVISRDCYKLLSLPGNPDVVIDIGAHIGSFAHLIHTLYPQSRILCAEPVAANYELLCQNAPYAQNFNVALWYGLKQPVIYHTEAQTGSDIVTDAPEQFTEFINELGYEYAVAEQQVNTCSLTALLLNADIDFTEKAALLKCDAEGVERDLLQDIARQNIGHYFTYVCGEWHHDLSGSARDLGEALDKAFPHLDFTVTNYGINSLFHSW